MTTYDRSYRRRFTSLTRCGKRGLIVFVLMNGGISSAIVLPADSPEQAHRRDIGKQIARMTTCISKAAARCEARGVSSAVECDLVAPEASTVPDPKGKIVAKLSAAIAKCEAKLDLTKKGPSSGYEGIGCAGDSDRAVPADQPYTGLDDYQANVGREVREALARLGPVIDPLCGGPDSDDATVRSCVA